SWKAVGFHPQTAPLPNPSNIEIQPVTKLPHTMTSSPTRAELYEVAKVTARILKSSGLPCFLVGGMACAAYGTSRLPNVSGV
ncbi:hypothetical protein ID866_4581, partial [Astraeus odoratus]